MQIAKRKTMTIHIPEWALWAVGLPVGIIAIGLAITGGIVLWQFRNGLF